MSQISPDEVRRFVMSHNLGINEYLNYLKKIGI